MIRMVRSAPALVMEYDRRYLVISDVHAGFEAGLDSKGISVGKNTTIRETVDEINRLISREHIDSTMLLGDVLSGTGSIDRREWDDVPVLLDGINSDVVIIPGNHDGGLAKIIQNMDRQNKPDITMSGKSGLVIENTLLTHGHAMPSNNFSHVDKIIMGHLHSVYLDEASILHGSRVWVSMTAQKSDLFPGRSGELGILVLPSFNRYLYAYRKRDRDSTSPIIRRLKNITSAKVITLDGSIIGGPEMLPQIL